jgi:excisionase family DNA binding protein
MSEHLVTVEQAATELSLHVKTVLRYIREGKLTATRIGKGYRIDRANLDAFSGVAAGRDETDARATCIVDVPDMTVESAGRLASLLQSAALTGDADTPRLHLETVFDPQRGSLKVIIIGSPADGGRLLEMLQLQVRRRP